MDIGVLNTAIIIGPVFLTYLHILTVALAIVGYLALMLFLQRSRWGQAIRAVSSAPGDGTHGRHRSRTACTC